ncbi:MAG: pyridoxal-phosphate dependent enzyme [bacterium]|nr:pyridoxal-phosphate dependent enzyme [bacterium]
MTLSLAEEKILKSIVIPSENDPNKPEFPPGRPRFPATPTYRINIPGFKNVWLKDESKNPTGTHKDRMAWEVVVTYRDIFLAKKRGQYRGELPQMSVISFGSAAVAIQRMLRKYRLPNLKVLIDRKFIPQQVLRVLKKLACEIYETDLSKRPLSWKEILSLTHNRNGLDITSNEALDPTTRFYDWLSYEIINNSPDYVFIPFGTGNLYENILNINKREVSTRKHDPRFKGDVEILRKCNFLGATTNNPNSRAEKLYSPHLPFMHYDEQWIKLYRVAGFCGEESDVYLLKEEYLDEALSIAKSQKINCEPSGIAGLALMLQLRNKLPKDKKMLIVNTGKTKYA